MLKISTNTSGFYSRMNIGDSVRLIRDAGFDCYDCTLCDLPEAVAPCFSKARFRKSALELRQYADSLGIICNQAHAEFPTSRGNKADAEIFQTLVENVEAAAILGAKIIVVHPMQHLNYAEHPRELFQMNVEFYQKLIPYAEKFNIKIATENMWQCNNGSHIPSDSVCSRAWEFCELIDAVDSPWLVGCFDIGHASLMDADIPAFIKAMGADRLQALHIHDTDFVHDDHTLPYIQKIDFSPILSALKEIGYRGDITFEAHSFFQRFPDALLLDAAKLMRSVGKYFSDQIAD